MFDIPIAIIFFIREEKLKKVFERIKEIKPRELFLIQDGPRLATYQNDMEKIEKCREIFKDIDWECNVHKNFSEVNLGCGKRPATGISWAFENVEKMIILEDDCIPDKSFFYFCEKMLNKYENNDKIMLISGMNLLGECNNVEYSYFFSRVCTIGAWATWKRVWRNYDFYLNNYNYKEKNKLKKIINNRKAAISKINAWDLTKEKARNKEKINWWDYQFHYLLYHNAGYGIMPKMNLIKNIGYGEDSTNVSDTSARHFNLVVGKMDKELIEPTNVCINNKFDNEVYDIQTQDLSIIRIILSKLKRKCMRTLKKKVNINER